MGKRSEAKDDGSSKMPSKMWLFLFAMLLFTAVLYWLPADKPQSEQDADWYAILGVSEKADAKEIKKAYRKKALSSHPDKRPSKETEGSSSSSQGDTFHLVAKAYEILSDPAKRAAYDRSLTRFGGNEDVDREDIMQGGMLLGEQDWHLTKNGELWIVVIYADWNMRSKVFAMVWEHIVHSLPSGVSFGRVESSREGRLAAQLAIIRNQMLQFPTLCFIKNGETLHCSEDVFSDCRPAAQSPFKIMNIEPTLQLAGHTLKAAAAQQDRIMAKMNAQDKKNAIRSFNWAKQELSKHNGATKHFVQAAASCIYRSISQHAVQGGVRALNSVELQELVKQSTNTVVAVRSGTRASLASAELALAVASKSSTSFAFNPIPVVLAQVDWKQAQLETSSTYGPVVVQWPNKRQAPHSTFGSTFEAVSFLLSQTKLQNPHVQLLHEGSAEVCQPYCAVGTASAQGPSAHSLLECLGKSDVLGVPIAWLPSAWNVLSEVNRAIGVIRHESGAPKICQLPASVKACHSVIDWVQSTATGSSGQNSNCFELDNGWEKSLPSPPAPPMFASVSKWIRQRMQSLPLWRKALIVVCLATSLFLAISNSRRRGRQGGRRRRLKTSAREQGDGSETSPSYQRSGKPTAGGSKQHMAGISEQMFTGLDSDDADGESDAAGTEETEGEQLDLVTPSALSESQARLAAMREAMRRRKAAKSAAAANSDSS